MIALFFALKNEIGRFKKKIDIINEYKVGSSNITEARFDGVNIALVQTGVGIKNAKDAADNILKDNNIKFIISSGIAGALKDGIEVGDVVYSNNVLLSTKVDDTSEEIIIDDNKYGSNQEYSKLVENLCKDEEIPFHIGDAITVNRVISNASEKDKLGKVSSAISVDMETFSIAESAVNNNVPFICVRSISDDVKSDLHLDKLSEMTEDGKIDITKSGVKAIKNAQYIPHLLKLKKQAAIASNSLSRIIFILIKELSNKI